MSQTSKFARRLAGASVAVTLFAAIGLVAAATDGVWSGPITPASSVSHLTFFGGSLHQLDSDLVAVAPHHDHLYGIVSVQFVTCGPRVRILTPAQMARRPVNLSLIYLGREVASAHLVDQPRFNFLAVGPLVRHDPIERDTHEQAPQWSPSFILKSSNGGDMSFAFGGIADIGGVIISYPPCIA